MFWSAIIAALIVSAISFVGAMVLFLKRKVIHSIVGFLVALSAGSLIGGAFLHLMPEAFKYFERIEYPFLLMITGFAGFFILERFIHWRHCHEDDCKIHPVGYMNIVGDGLHNFFDGLLLAAAFSVDFHLGVVTTLAIILHEIPQEIGDFGVLLHAGFSAKKALILNFMTAMTAVFGVIFGFMLGGYVDNFEMILIPVAAGGFLHIGASDLVPELHKEKDIKKALMSFIFFLAGIAIMSLLVFFMPHGHGDEQTSELTFQHIDYSFQS